MLRDRSARVTDDARSVGGGGSDRRSVPVLHANLLLSERPARRPPAARLSHLHGAARVAVGRARSAPAVDVRAVRISDDPHHRLLRAYRAGGPALGPGTAGERRRSDLIELDVGVCAATQLRHQTVADWTQRVENIAVAQKRHRNARLVRDY